MIGLLITLDSITMENFSYKLSLVIIIILNAQCSKRLDDRENSAQSQYQYLLASIQVYRDLTAPWPILIVLCESKRERERMRERVRERDDDKDDYLAFSSLWTLLVEYKLNIDH